MNSLERYLKKHSYTSICLTIKIENFIEFGTLDIINVILDQLLKHYPQECQNIGAITSDV